MQFVITQRCFRALNNHFLYKPNGINLHQLFNCNQGTFINNVNVFTICLASTSAHDQSGDRTERERARPCSVLYETINEYGLLCLLNFTLAGGSLIFLGI